MAGNEYVGFKVSLPIGNEVGEVDTQDLLRVAAATADGETVSAIVKADDEAFLVFTVVVHCYFFSWAKPEGKGGGGGFLVMGVGGTVGIDNLVEIGKVDFDGSAIVEADDVGVIRGRVLLGVGNAYGFDGATLCSARIGLGHIDV